jgi:Uma2 family endonuclease
MGQSPLHSALIALLTELARKINSNACHAGIQLPVVCPPDGEPEPDLSIIRGTPRDYLDRLPGPGDVTCAIEGAHSSLDRDREDKLPIYAAAGIPQYIIVNLQNYTLEVYTDPDPASEQYRTKVTVDRGGSVALLRPGAALTITAAEILP